MKIVNVTGSFLSFYTDLDLISEPGSGHFLGRLASRGWERRERLPDGEREREVARWPGLILCVPDGWSHVSVSGRTNLENYTAHWVRTAELGTWDIF